MACKLLEILSGSSRSSDVTSLPNSCMTCSEFIVSCSSTDALSVPTEASCARQMVVSALKQKYMTHKRTEPCRKIVESDEHSYENTSQLLTQVLVVLYCSPLRMCRPAFVIHIFTSLNRSYLK